MNTSPQEWLTTDFPEFGHPTYKGTLDSLVSWRKDLVSGPGTKDLGRIGLDEILRTTAYSPLEFQKNTKGDDRIFTGFILDKYPVIVVADGASDTQTTQGNLVSGGGTAAQESVMMTVKALADIKDGLDSIDIQYILESAFVRSEEALRNKGINSGTTLLVGFPYIHRGRPGKGDVALWHYGYVGDGDITLISKGRKIDGRAISTHLLTPQKVDSTASVQGKGATVTPFIGSCRYTPGDSLLITTDGFDGPNREYLNKHKLSIPFVLGNYPRSPSVLLHEIAQTFRSFRFSDDAVLGFVNTEVNKK